MFKEDEAFSAQCENNLFLLGLKNEHLPWCIAFVKHTQSIMAFNKENEEKIVVAKHCLSWSDTDS